MNELLQSGEVLSTDEIALCAEAARLWEEYRAKWNDEEALSEMTNSLLWLEGEFAKREMLKIKIKEKYLQERAKENGDN